MKDKLRWTLPGEEFEDGSHLSGWTKIESSPWHWQYDTHELAFDIYEHAGGYWKLYRIRSVAPGATGYTIGFGGLACRVALVEYRQRAASPHSRVLKDVGELEWVRVEEVDPVLHRVVRCGERKGELRDTRDSTAHAPSSRSSDRQQHALDQARNRDW